MKPRSVLLGASIAGNIALAAAFLARPAPQDDPSRVVSGDASPAADALPEAPASGPRALDENLWERLRSVDPALFEQNLRRAGLPDHLVSALVGAEARERIRLRQQGGGAPAATPSPTGVASAKVAVAAARDPATVVFLNASARIDPIGRDLAFIDPARREQALAISTDYDALIDGIRRDARGMLTPSEKEMIETLEAERRQDLEGLLTARELADYEIVKSPLYSRLTYELQELAPTAEEFRAIFAAEQELAERFGADGMRQAPPSPAEREAVQQARATVDEQLLRQLGAERFAEYDRSRHHEYRQLAQLVRRVNLPAELAAEVFSMRDYVSAESNRINEDNNLTTDAKRAALATLATDTRHLIRERLGEEAGSAYLQSADRWLNAVENGAAVSFPTANGISFRHVGRPIPPPPPGG